jgi:ribosomal protein S18 acetylase RimI-like enzyme
LIITISAATENDIPVLREIFLTTRLETFSWVESSAYTLEDFDKETKGEDILVAHANDETAGFISVWLPDNFIHHLYVRSSLHGLGIGKRLLDHTIAKLAAAVRLKCLTENVTAIDFYKKYGFEEIERGSSSDGDYILFEKDGRRDV